MAKILMVISFLVAAWFFWGRQGRTDADSGFSDIQPVVKEQRGVGRHGDKGDAIAEMPSGQRQKLMEWANGTKRAYVEKADALRFRMDGRMTGGYEWGRASEQKARNALVALDTAIDNDKFMDVESLLANATEAVRLFEAGCRWQSGSRHRNFRHIYASDEEGTWYADDGWFFIDPQRSLAVARECRSCRGTGQVRGMVPCGRCGGLGQLPGLLGGRISCGACNGRGKVRGMVDCNNCHGSGRILAQ